MAINPYFKRYNSQRHQYLAERLILESIKREGYDIKYIPRKNNNINEIFGEDLNTSFENAATIEVFIKNIDSFGGQRYMSKFMGIDIQDQITFTISKLRFEQSRTENLQLEHGYMFQLETRPEYTPNVTHNIKMETASSENYIIESSKPLEGDLIWFPMVNKMFEIKNVAFETMFYQTGTLQVYDLECQIYNYSDDTFDTNDEEINDTMNSMSSNLKLAKFNLEDGSSVLTESNGNLIQEEAAIESVESTARNKLFTDEANKIVDWSEKSPLVGGDFLKW